MTLRLPTDVTTTPAAYVSACGTVALDALMRPTTGDRSGAEVLPLVVSEWGQMGDYRFRTPDRDYPEGTRVIVRLAMDDDAWAIGTVEHGEEHCQCGSCGPEWWDGVIAPDPVRDIVHELRSLPRRLRTAVKAGDVTSPGDIEAFETGAAFAELVMNGTPEQMIAYLEATNGFWWDWIVTGWSFLEDEVISDLKGIAR
jgi:hypothetical protein